MGTRLYPMTNDVAVLERLAGVPAGTYATLQAWKKFATADNDPAVRATIPSKGYEMTVPVTRNLTFKGCDGNWVWATQMVLNTVIVGRVQAPDGKWHRIDGYEQYEPFAQIAFSHMPVDCRQLDDFLLYGWGRFWPKSNEQVYDDPCFGQAYAPALVDRILTRRGISTNGVPLTEIGGICWS